MRLVHVEPSSLTGKTIVFRGQSWLVEGKDNSGLHLSKQHPNETKGKLLYGHIKDCRLFPGSDLIRMRHPRLIRLLCEVCLLTSSEAEHAIQGYLLNGFFDYGGEAVSRIGGSRSAIRHALTHRHRAQRAFRARQTRSSGTHVQTAVDTLIDAVYKEIRSDLVKVSYCANTVRVERHNLPNVFLQKDAKEVSSLWKVFIDGRYCIGMETIHDGFAFAANAIKSPALDKNLTGPR